MKAKLRYLLTFFAMCVVSSFVILAVGCNEQKPEENPMCKHEMIDDKVIKEATCETLGVKTVKCVHCGETETVDVDYLPHTEMVIKAVAPTCTESGLTSGIKCVVCEKILVAQKVANPMGHKVVIDDMVAPTCTATGKTEGSHCQYCGLIFIKQESIEALGHNAITMESWEATCEKEGYTGGSRCENCGEVYTGTSLPALGHSYGIGEVTKAVTCEFDGERIYTCTRCSDVKSEVIPALGHSYDNGVVTKGATCETNGLKTYTCATCKGTQEETISAFGHNYNEGVTTKAASCEAAGIKTFTCANCGGTQEELLPALGHSYNEGEITTSASCETVGVKTYTCTLCSTTKTESIPASGHTYEGNTCSSCGNIKDSNVEEDALQGTWIWDSWIIFDNGGARYKTFNVNFTSNGKSFTSLATRHYNNSGGGYYEMLYDTTSAFYDDLADYHGWTKEAYRAITITDKLEDVADGEELLEYLNMYATKVIVFTINGLTHYAESGMTWQEWCASDYNTADYLVHSESGSIVLDEETPWMRICNDAAGLFSEKGTDTIVAGYKYYYGSHAGGSND